jgi:sugar (pentulose or hexulose) kinase
MTTKDLILAIDNGTQSLKAMVFTPRGETVAFEKTPFEPYYSKKPGWAEQEPNLFWDILATTCRALFERDDSLCRSIVGLSITTQRATVVNLDSEGTPLRPAIVWPDERRADRHPPVGVGWTLLFKLLGLSETTERLFANSEAVWIAQHQPEIWEKTKKFLFLSGYLIYKLTGEFKDSVGSQVGYIPFDYKRLTWAKPWDWKRKGIPLSIEQLPELVQQGDVLGRVTREASLHTGIPEGLPVVASATDQACAVLGAGCLQPHIGCLSYGTTATINVTSKKYIEPIFLIPPYPAALPGSHTMEIQIYRGFWMVTWFKKEFCHLEQEKAKKLGVEAEQLFDELIADIEPGCMGLMLQPYWTPGIKMPGPEAKGAIIGFGDVHRRAHVYKAILEGLAFALREGKERIERRTRIPITDIMVSGGGSQSANAMQVTADIFGLPARRPHVYETSGLGAAINAAVGLGLHPDYKTAIEAMTHMRDEFTPDPKARALYDRLYREVYLKMYKRLKPLYTKIKEITGYPEN